MVGFKVEYDAYEIEVDGVGLYWQSCLMQIICLIFQGVLVFQEN
jgi:hypothetical protein